MGQLLQPQPAHELHRHFGLLQATALNVTAVVGAGVFVTIPLMLRELPGPYALLGWLAAGVLMLADGMIWSELGATLPGSGGTYLYLLEAYGRRRWGRLMAFLFIWQFLLSGPLEVASALIAGAAFSTALSPEFATFNAQWTWKLTIWPQFDVAIMLSPSRLGAFGVGVLILLLLYRRVASLGRLTVAFWLAVLAAIAWIMIEGALAFDPAVAFDFTGSTAANLGSGLGPAMILAIYSYLGYYQVCYVGDEVREPSKTIPRSILLSVALVGVLFVGLHLAMLGTVPWRSVPTESPQIDDFSLPAEFMRRLHGNTAATLITLLLMASCFGGVFAALLGFSRIPFGAARYGHFFAVLGRVHPVHRIPHVALLLVGGLTLFWSFFDLEQVIKALISTRILEQFVAQIGAVVLLRHNQPERPRPYRMWLYPLPCGLALAGWLYAYVAAGALFIGLGMLTLLGGVVAFLLWSYYTRGWPCGPAHEEVATRTSTD
jgi:amino acid transporter